MPTTQRLEFQSNKVGESFWMHLAYKIWLVWHVSTTQARQREEPPSILHSHFDCDHFLIQWSSMVFLPQLRPFLPWHKVFWQATMLSERKEIKKPNPDINLAASCCISASLQSVHEDDQLRPNTWSHAMTQISSNLDLHILHILHAFQDLFLWGSPAQVCKKGTPLIVAEQAVFWLIVSCVLPWEVQTFFKSDSLIFCEQPVSDPVFH